MSEWVECLEHYISSLIFAMNAVAEYNNYFLQNILQ